MSRIVTYKEGFFSQIKLTSGERIMFSCAEGGATIFKMKFFGLVPDFKIAEWKLQDLGRFMLLFGGAPLNQTPFNFVVQKLTSFDSVKQLREFLAQEPNPFELAHKEHLAAKMQEVLKNRK